MNKEVATTASFSAVVKKGTAVRESKATVDGSKIILAMDAKLTAGAYTVTITGLEAATLTADLTVEKDETLTTYDVSDYIVAKTATNTTTGVIKFDALNQYGEKMAADTPQVSCSFGTVANGAVTAPTATKEGNVEVTNITPVLALVGTKGTVVLVDTKSGVTVTKEISYNTAATASTLELAGAYHVNSGTIKSIAENNTISEYELLFTAKDQYGYSMSAADFNNGKVSASLAGGLTNIKLRDAAENARWNSRTVAGVDYITLELTGNSEDKAVAGDATLTVVNPSKGLLLTTAITVVKDVVIKTLNITADNGVYAGQDNELSYESIDSEGKNVTNYAVLSQVLSLPSGMRLVKNADGSAKLIYRPGENPRDTQEPILGKASTIEPETIYANKPTSGDYLVKPVSFTVYQKRAPKSVTGIASDAVTSVAPGQMLTIKSYKLLLADQYSNRIANTEDIFVKAVSSPAISITGTAVKVIGRADVIPEWAATNGAITVTAGAVVGTATVYLKFNAKGEANFGMKADGSDADARFTISVTNTKVAANVEIESVFDGYAKKVATGSAVTVNPGDVKVVGTAGGSKTTIPESQYVIVKVDNDTITKEEADRKVTSKTATVTVQVTTKDASGNEIETLVKKDFEISLEAAKVYKVTGVADVAKSSTAVSTGAAKAVSAATLQSYFKFTDQYNQNKDVAATVITSGKVAGNVKYTANLKEASNGATSADYEVLRGNGQNGIAIAFAKAGTYVVTITAETVDGSKKSVDITFVAN